MLAVEVQLFPDKTFFIQLILFLTVLFVLHFLVFRPILKILRYRFEKTEGDRKRIESLTQKTEALISQYEGRMKSAKKEAQILKETIRKEGMEQASRMIQDAKELRMKELEKIQQEVSKATAEAEKKLEAQAKDLGIQMAEKVLEKKI